MRIEFVYALADDQLLINLDLGVDAVAADAIDASGVRSMFPECDIDALQAGVWGRPVERAYQLKEGDRVELYRPLQRSPRDARREMASTGMTMRGAAQS